jgi:hypothetical protein
MNDDPKPNLDPGIFIKDLISTILAERGRLGIAPETMCSLDLRYDNSYIGGLLSDRDISENIMMETNCPLTVKNYMNPIGNDFSGSEDKYKQHSHSFNTATKATVAYFANVSVAFLLTPIDGHGNIIPS